ncbi:glycine--tRNA ligase subunit beta [Cardiobacterium valvarum]|uniref:Glycine--tRNA ligase beta subunit n=1 Tax=Cardiobacterium valvarum F0432 TaxID=797473 RepID=G9ZEQ5_9GAMM|nr:glycine--tRNA ligase subunit beta [Cardiobacterium valvarum]EHM54524.1 glycine--tRNA ligase, beta subunit [Cardiobacterium valvarum F0432]
MTTTLLIEIGVEELPTKAVTALAAAGRDLWDQALSDAALAHGNIDTFATPRRLAWRIHDLAEKQPDQKIERKGPSLAAAKDKDGNWTKAALGFAASCGVEASDLGVEETGKGAWLTYHGEQAGQTLETLLPELFRHVCDNLPIAKRMRWGDNEQSFVRPVLTLVVLADERILPLDYFGVRAGRDTLGHRVHHPEPVSIQSAASYEADLRAAHVIASHAERMARIREQVEKEAAALGGGAILPEALLIENASLTEWPVAISGSFDERYLAVPQEVLITTMQDNQKTFAVVDASGRIQPHFIAIANLESQDPATVRKGNEKVIRPRFADAEFFWQQDLKHRLADYLPRLEAVTYQDKLGSLADKARRLETLARELAAETGADAEHAATAARLSKSDLLSEMVMEFPELQGIMGRYYAAAEGLPADIAAAIDEQYYPRGAGGELPQSPTGLTLALAEKLDTLVGGFAIGAKPTGSKDPYALRRMAISLIRLINENNLNLPLDRALAASAATYPAALAADKHTAAVRDYIRERLDSYYREQSIRSETVQAVLALDSDDLVDNDRRIRALDTFASSDNVKNLLASAKRIRNILKKNGERDGAVQTALLQEPAEQALWQAWQDKQPAFGQALAAGDYRAALEPLATLGAPLDAFFTDVMVMSDDPALQQNRLTLLTTLQRGFDKIADLSLLSE